MPLYIYKAKDGPKKTVQNQVAAESHAAAVARIEGLGLSPVWVRVKEGGGAEAKRPSERGIRRSEVTIFTRQLASLLRSGVPILRALHTISQQTENKRLSCIVEDIEGTVRDGSMLSEALINYPRLFPSLYVNMVRSGEMGGVLDTILFRLAEAGEAEEETRRKVQAAMAYPALVAIVGVSTVFVLLAFFMPRIMALFEDYNDLPLPTRILINVSDFFSNYWYWILIIGFAVFAVFRRLVLLDKGKTLLDSIKLRIPLLGRFLKEVDIVRFSRTFSLLMESGIPIDKVLELSVNTLHSAVLQTQIEDVRTKTVHQGLPMSEGLRRATEFPAFVANMVAVGEESGHLEDSLNEIAQFYENSVDRQSRMVTSMLEPIMLLVVGGIVGFIVFAMLLPIFEIGGALR